MEKYYTVYLASNEEIVAFGNSKQCAKKLGLKGARQFHALVSKTRSGLLKKYEIDVADENRYDLTKSPSD